MFFVYEEIRYRDVSTIRGVFDDELSANSVGEEEESAHASRDVVGAIEFCPVFLGQEAFAQHFESSAHRLGAAVP